MVDYPGAAYWRDLAGVYPDAKVLHSVRDPDEWFDSTQATIFARRPPGKESAGATAAFMKSFLGDLLPHLSDRTFITDYFRRHTAAVISAIPAERLLVYQARQGWEPLCAFLGAPIPDSPYPSENNRAEFVARAAARQTA